MNNLGNIKFISNDPYKSRREFIKKKGDRPETEWEDHIKEIEPLPFHTQEFPILFFDCNVCEIENSPATRELRLSQQTQQKTIYSRRFTPRIF